MESNQKSTLGQIVLTHAWKNVGNGPASTLPLPLSARGCETRSHSCTVKVRRRHTGARVARCLTFAFTKARGEDSPPPPHCLSVSLILVSIIYIGRNRKLQPQRCWMRDAGVVRTDSARRGRGRVSRRSSLISRLSRDVGSQWQAKKRIRPWRVHGDATFASLHVNLRVHEAACTKGTRFARQNELKLFLTLSLSLSLTSRW